MTISQLSSLFCPNRNDVESLALFRMLKFCIGDNEHASWNIFIVLIKNDIRSISALHDVSEEYLQTFKYTKLNETDFDLLIKIKNNIDDILKED